MSYWYKIKIRFRKGNQYIIKDYIRSFLNIGELFVFLEIKHKGNYEVVSIKGFY